MPFWVFHFTSNAVFFCNLSLLPSKYFSILCFYTAMMTTTTMISVIITKMGSLQVTLLVLGQHGNFRHLISCSCYCDFERGNSYLPRVDKNGQHNMKIRATHDMVGFTFLKSFIYPGIISFFWSVLIDRWQLFGVNYFCLF